MTKITNQCLKDFLGTEAETPEKEVLNKKMKLKVLREAAKLTGNNQYNRFNILLQDITENKRVDFSTEELMTIKDAAAVVYKNNIIKQKQISIQVNKMKEILSDIGAGEKKLIEHYEKINKTNIASKLIGKPSDLSIKQKVYFSIFSQLAGRKGTGFIPMEITKKTVEKELGQLLAEIHVENGKFKTAETVREQARLFYIEAFGGDSGNAQIKKLYKEYDNYLKYVYKQYNDAGVYLGDLSDYRIFQKHIPELLIKYGKDDWVNFQMDLLDWDKMRFKDGGIIPKEKRVKVLEKAYDTITTRGMSDAPEVAINEATGGIKGGGSGKMSLANELSQDRFFIYKDAESQFKYNEKYGSPDLFNEITTISFNDAGNLNLLRRMGPDPDKTYKLIEKMMIKDGIDRNGIDQVWKQYAEVNPRLREQGSVFIANVGEALRSFSIMAKVPSLIISSIPDIGYAGVEKSLREIDDGNLLTTSGKRLFAGYYHSLSHGVKTVKQMMTGFDQMTKKDQVLKFAVVDAFNWKMSRFTGIAENAETVIGGYDPSSKINKFKNGVGYFNNQLKRINNFHYKASLMNEYSQQAKVGITVDILTDLTMLRDKNFNELNSYYKDLFDNYGFTEQDFNNLKNFDTEKHGDFDILTFNSMKTFKNMNRKEAVELQRKINGIIEVMIGRSFMEQSNLAKTTFKTGKGGAKGTISYQAGQAIGQFKTFGITYMLERIAPIFNAPTFREGIANAGLGWFVAMPFGYAAYNMQNIINGITPEPINEDNYGKVAVKSWLMTGGLGIFGDVAFGNYAKQNRDILDAIAGPSGQSLINLVKGGSLVANHLLEVLTGQEDPNRETLNDVNFGKQITKTIDTLTPTADLWYLKMAKKYYIDNVLNEALNENYREEKERQRRNLQKTEQKNFIYDYYK